MVLQLLDKHLQFLEHQIEFGLVVYKGFPSEFIQKISESIAFLSNEIQVYDDGKVDIHELVDKKKKVVSSFLKLDGIKISTYEEFTLVCKNISPDMLDYNIIIVENDLFREWFPNPSTIRFPDLMYEIESNDNFDPDSIFTTFYSNSQIMDGLNYISYYDFNANDFKSVKRINFFEQFIQGKQLKLDTATDDNELIELPSADNYFQRVKTDFYYKKQDNKYRFVVSEKVHHFDEQRIRRELLILKTIADLKGVEFAVYAREEKYEEKVRREFYQILNKYWQSDSFRSLLFYKEPDYSNKKIEITQGQIIEYIVEQSESAVKNQKYRDVFVTAPTGSGKSLLFQIPAVYLSDEYGFVTIVVSPLKALMYDQVIALKEKGILSACFINSDISFIKRQETIDALHNGEKSILYLSPELLLSYNIYEFIGNRKVGLLVIDEAHLVSTWGRDFRVDYWYLGKYIRSLRKYSEQHFPVVALTATAVYGGDNDIVFQTIESLNMRLPRLYIGNVRRDEIHFNINAFTYSGNHEDEKIRRTREKIEENIRKSVKSICYFPWTRQIEATYLSISSDLKNRVGKYYGNVDQYERQDVINRFKNNDITCILATKAFGMGVDISDILEIYHHAPSGNLSDYVQEIGRVAREKALEGKAVVDFCEKDLKFARILYGLSSVKLYQIRLVLQKIFNIYELKKKQNLLFSVEDFQYIFPHAQDLDAKVKSTLLLIENDLLNKYAYYVVLVRPKSLYSNVFAEIPKTVEKKFLLNYGEYCKKIPKPRLNNTITIQTPTGLTITHKGSENNFYVIELDKLWEKHFFDESFPRVKKKYFNRELFYENQRENPIPLNKLSVTLNNSVSETFELLKNYMSILGNAFQDLSGHFFTRNELESALKNTINNRILRKRVVDLVLDAFSSRIQHQGNFLQAVNVDSFLQMRTESSTPKYRVISNSFYKVSKNIITQFSKMFSMNDPKFEKYLNPKSKFTMGYIKLAHLIESFQFGSYEFSGGILPQIFIRINDPFKVRLIANDEKYTNAILRDINNRHKSSMKVMEEFFTTELNDSDRWDFIEDHFLGKEELTFPENSSDAS